MRLDRYADDFLVMVAGTRGEPKRSGRGQRGLGTLGLRLSTAKTRVVTLTRGLTSSAGESSADPGASNRQEGGVHISGQEGTDLRGRPARFGQRSGRVRFAHTIQVYFHVITDGQTGALTNRQLNDQIAVLNNTFAGGEGGADTGFSFELAGVTRTDNADNAAWFYAGPSGVNQNSMKPALHQGGADALNHAS